MIETMYAAPGIGLAAPQVGVSLKIFVIDLSLGKDPASLHTMINPQFLERDGMSGAPLLAGDAAPADAAADEFFDAKDAETVATIKDLIETRVRPAVAGDGGDITFRGYKEGIVYLNMKGACSGCPSSTATLKHGIQNLLRHFVPDVVEVRPM